MAAQICLLGVLALCVSLSTWAVDVPLQDAVEGQCMIQGRMSRLSPDDDDPENLATNGTVDMLAWRPEELSFVDRLKRIHSQSVLQSLEVKDVQLEACSVSPVPSGDKVDWPACPKMGQFPAWQDFPANQEGYSRVMLASFPSSGNSWLRYLLNAAMQSGTCALYNEPQGPASLATPAGTTYCPTHSNKWQDPWAESSGVMIVKTHSDGCIKSEKAWKKQHMFNKLIILTRHPLDVMASIFKRRFGHGNIHGWYENMEHFRCLVGSERALVVHYEDLCANTVGEMERILEFIGKKDAGFHERFSQLLQNHPNLLCKYDSAKLAPAQSSLSTLNPKALSKYQSISDSIVQRWRMPQRPI